MERNEVGRNAPPLVRLWRKIRVGGPDECWPWLGSVNQSGHGRFNWGRHGGSMLRMPHRIVWEDKVGPIPDGLLVLHRCDVPRCCNPRHLFLGTQTDNMNDMYAKKRHKMWVGPTLCGHEPHSSKGLCRSCYNSAYCKKNRKRLSENWMKWYYRKQGKEIATVGTGEAT